MMINEVRADPSAYSYIEGLSLMQTETGIHLSPCSYYEGRLQNTFSMEEVDFNIISDSANTIGYGLHIVYVKATGTMEYKLFRMIADQDGYFCDYVDSTEYKLMKQILHISVSTDGERTGEFYLYPKGE